ncbi:MAG: quinone-dependent dihydroorotate dehydrogenase [Verrucomicrobia bacterium]|nr:quinone-dependent dihydroorotate dehydrogenase [Verrucomicrobiota bacterium]MDA1004893.1 quinone-dependent dihydroorotate dehydrogenase [Verrucomicrobiota bacterium]
MLDQLYPLARRALFALDAERAHHWSLVGLRLAERLGILEGLAGHPPTGKPVRCMGLTFPNALGLAAGLDKEGNCIDAFGRLGFGAIEIGTITPRPQPGNPKPRLFRLKEHEGIINRMGFNNPGIEQGVRNVHSAKSYQGIVGFNIGKNKDTPNENATEDYLIGLRAAWPVADYIAVNLSSPNTPGLRDLQAADSTAALLERLKQEQESLRASTGRQVPIALKVAPDLTDDHIAALSRVFLDGGLDGLIATNTTIERQAVATHPHGAEAGGLSGAPLTSRSTEVIAAFHAELGQRIPIIGVGGVMSGQDALAKISAGATLIQIYTAFIYRGPGLIVDILDSLNNSLVASSTE